MSNSILYHTFGVAGIQHISTIFFRQDRFSLYVAYYMKERLRLMFQCIDKERVKAELSSWIEQARTGGIRMLKDAARKLQV